VSKYQKTQQGAGSEEVQSRYDIEPKEIISKIRLPAPFSPGARSPWAALYTPHYCGVQTHRHPFRSLRSADMTFVASPCPISRMSLSRSFSEARYGQDIEIVETRGHQTLNFRIFSHHRWPLNQPRLVGPSSTSPSYKRWRLV
jgi:hypothetical protein